MELRRTMTQTFYNKTAHDSQREVNLYTGNFDLEVNQNENDEFIENITKRLQDQNTHKSIKMTHRKSTQLRSKTLTSNVENKNDGKTLSNKKFNNKKMEYANSIGAR